METQDDRLRLKVLKKGHSRRQLFAAMRVMQKHGVGSGGYILLNPAPGLEPEWAVEEAKCTLDWVLGDGPDSLGMDEAYFCATCVGQGTALAGFWEEGAFRPATLWMVLEVLQHAVGQYGPRAHLLPFADEPPFLAVPSNHVAAGIPEDLSGARGCDRAFHEMFAAYRATYDSSVLVAPQCTCG